MYMYQLEQLAIDSGLTFNNGRKLVTVRKPGDVIYINKLDSTQWTFQYRGENVRGPKQECIKGAIRRLTMGQ